MIYIEDGIVIEETNSTKEGLDDEIEKKEVQFNQLKWEIKKIRTVQINTEGTDKNYQTKRKNWMKK